jgi:hypothetical protein
VQSEPLIILLRMILRNPTSKAESPEKFSHQSRKWHSGNRSECPLPIGLLAPFVSPTTELFALHISAPSVMRRLSSPEIADSVGIGIMVAGGYKAAEGRRNGATPQVGAHLTVWGVGATEGSQNSTRLLDRHEKEWIELRSKPPPAGPVRPTNPSLLGPPLPFLMRTIKSWYLGRKQTAGTENFRSRAE